MFNIGDSVFDTTKNERVQILEKFEAWGFVSYKVFNAAQNAIYKLAGDKISTAPKDTNADINYLRYITLLSKIKNEIATGILTNLLSGIIPLPHQTHVLNRALSGNNIRYILADEVGLGKTIEAGLIIKELKTRGLIKRVLVVCPKGLVTQWGMEMEEKFNEKFVTILPEEYETIRKLTDCDNVYTQFDQVISPMDAIKPIERRAGWSEEDIEEYNEERIYSVINSGWDLVVIDEAHRVAGSSGEVARHKLGGLLASASPYLLLLTATPHNGKTEPFLRLVRLVDEQAFPNFRAVVKEQVAPYLIRTEKREAIDNEGNKLFKNRFTKSVELNWDARHSMQKELYELTTEYVAKGYNKAMRNRGKFMWLIFLLIMMQRLVTSSTAAIRTSLEKRIRVLEEQAFTINRLTEEEFLELELEENYEQVIGAVSADIHEEIAELSKIVMVAKQAEFQYTDVKVEPLIDIVDSLYTEDKNRKVIIFTEFKATQSYISKLLREHNYTTSLLNGSLSIDERNAVVEEFRAETNILISTDAGGEGINFQFANVVINYDLPWNPMKIEQRIGRVDRIGQQRDVFVFNFILAETVENRVRTVLENKLALILKELGIDKYGDVMDSEISELNFTEAYLNSIRHPGNIEKNLKPIEQDLKTQIDNAQRFKELIHEEKDLTALIGSGSNFHIEPALRQMVVYYENYKGNPYFPLYTMSINDSEITKHLNCDSTFSREDGVMVVNIEDFVYEKGYFSLWEIALNDKQSEKRVIPIFVTKDFIHRPVAGKKIWEEMINPASKIKAAVTIPLDESTFDTIAAISREFAYETFLNMKAEYEKKNEEKFRKYLYALQLRLEAANRIGIDNIRTSKLTALSKEKIDVEAQYEAGKQICPAFKPLFMACLE